MTRLTRLWSQHPDHTVVRERSYRVHQPVDQVPVIVPPPQQYDVDDFVSVLVEQLGTTGVLDISTDVVVGVFVPPQLLDNLIFLNTQSEGEVRGVTRHDHRRD